MENDAFLVIRNLNKSYEGRAALKSVSLSLREGDFLSLFGPNGAGKTTLLKIIATLTTPDSGGLEVTGYDLEEEREEFKRRLGVISHHSLLYDDMTARENLVFYGTLFGVDGPSERADELLRLVDLYRRKDSRVSQFSRGMRQRLSIARALVNDPSILLLDEPFSGLDRYAASMLSEKLEELRSRKRTVILVTHNLGLGLKTASKVGVLAAGELVLLEERNSLDPAKFEERYLQLIRGSQVA